jgi:hypothetical protein
MTEQQLKAGVHDGSIPSAVADTGATSSIETTKDKCRNAFIPTGRQSTKAFHMPNGAVEVATDVDKLHHIVCHPAKDIHIISGIKHNLLLSMAKFADANYNAIFDKDELNIYNANNTKVTSLTAPSFAGGNAWTQTFGVFLWYSTLPTTTQRPSYAPDHQQVLTAMPFTVG